MCDACDGLGGDEAKRGVSRRRWLAMGGSMGVGVVLGLWSCKGEGTPAVVGKGELASTKGAASTASTTERATVNATVAKTQAEAGASAPAATSTNASSSQATTAVASGPAPDLGAEVFPDARGRAIAKASDAPVIVVPRTDWTKSGPNLSQIVLMNGVNRITVHHTAGVMTTDAWVPTAGDLEGIRAFHAGTRPTDRNWADIAYHFAVDRAGRVWQARPLAYQGAHARQHNEHNLGIVLLGDFQVQSPSAAQLTALAGFVGFVRKLYEVPLERVYTHGELVETECPGKRLQEYMDRARKAWGVGEGVAWDKVTTWPAGDGVGAAR